NDSHWQRFHSAENTEAEILHYVQQGIDRLIESLKRNQVTGIGTLSTGQELHKKLCLILKKLEGMPLGCNQNKTVLIQLGIIASYCPEAYKEAVDHLYRLLCSERWDTLSLRGRVALLLEDERYRLFRVHFDSPPESRWTSWANRLIMERDLHRHNMFFAAYGHIFGLRDRSEILTETANQHGLVLRLWHALLDFGALQN
ncbi:MAG: hypothetical protein Q8O19_04750, partial [Rectinemataceae bacterium]|nr:hypothetical protein [Rectinemataceae bacterium]